MINCINVVCNILYEEEIDMSPTRREFVKKVGVVSFSMAVVDILNPGRLMAACNFANDVDCTMPIRLTQVGVFGTT